MTVYCGLMPAAFARSQQDLAARAGLAVGAIRNLEAGRPGVRMSTVRAVVGALRAAGVTMDAAAGVLTVRLEPPKTG